MKGKIGWTALIAVFIAVAFLPGVFAQQTAIESGVAVEAREQAEEEAGVLGGMDLGALIGGALSGLLGALGGALSGIIAGCVSLMGVTFAALVIPLMMLAGICCGSTLVGLPLTAFVGLPLTAFVGTKFYGMSGVFNFLLGALADLGAILGICPGCPVCCVGAVNACLGGMGFIVSVFYTISAGISGLLTEFLGVVDGCLSLCINPFVCCAGCCGGLVTFCAGIAGVLGSVITLLINACVGCISCIPALSPGTICGGLFEGCPTCLICSLPCGAIGCINPVLLDLCGDAVCITSLTGCMSGVVGALVGALIGVCGPFIQGLSCIDGCASCIINPCTSVFALFAGVLQWIMAAIFDVVTALYTGLCGACCAGGNLGCLASGPLFCGSLIEYCLGCCKLPCVLF